MPTEFWYPISDATHDLPAAYDDFTNVGGANKNASCRPGGGRAGPMTHDDGTTRVTIVGAGQQSFNADWPGPMGSLPSGYTFTAGFRDNTTGGTSIRGAYFSNAAATLGALIVSRNGGPDAYATYGPSDATSAKPGGGAWVVSDFADDMTYFPLYTVSAGGVTHNLTSIWGQIQYEPPVGGFAFLLNLAGLMALPFVGRMADFAQFSAYLGWRRVWHPRRTIMEPHEVMTAWREYREYRWPTYLEMAA